MSVEYRKLTAQYEHELVQRNENRLYAYMKRFIDIIGAFIGLILSFPIILLSIIAIKIEDNGPGFYKQERLGLEGKTFYIIKLRSMYIDAEKNGAQWATKNDPRVTKVGGIIRKTRIDELPQLINILMGEMSFIGPRPERPVFTEEFSQQIPGFKKRLQVKPGLTGWAQVNGGYDITPKEKLQLDLYYIKKRNLKMELIIFFKTIKVVFTGDGAR